MSRKTTQAFLAGFGVGLILLCPACHKSNKNEKTQSEELHLKLNKNGLHGGDGWLDAVDLERLKQLPSFEAKVSNVVTDSDYAMFTLTTRAGQTFAVQENNPGSNFISLLNCLKPGNYFSFPQIVFENERKISRKESDTKK